MKNAHAHARARAKSFARILIEESGPLNELLRPDQQARADRIAAHLRDIRVEGTDPLDAVMLVFEAVLMAANETVARHPGETDFGDALGMSFGIHARLVAAGVLRGRA